MLICERKQSIPCPRVYLPLAYLLCAIEEAQCDHCWSDQNDHVNRNDNMITLTGGFYLVIGRPGGGVATRCWVDNLLNKPIL